MKKIRLLLIEDNRLLREGISSLLKQEDDIEVIEALGTNGEVLQKLRSFDPHVMLLDLGLTAQNSLQIVKMATTKSPATKVIVMDLVPLQGDVLEFVGAGVSGFILKDANFADFLKTIRSVAGGGKVLPALVTGSLFSQIVDQAFAGEGRVSRKLIDSVFMTKREREVIDLISQGLSNKEIAKKLHLSTYTVKSHVHNILEKLAIHTRVQISNYSRNHIIPKHLS